MERDVFLKLQSDRERDLFIEAFWKQRDPNTGTPENEFKTEHARRIAHANRYLGRDAPQPGWRTDRGRMYIILGEPRDIQRFEGKSSTYDAEIWFYQGLTDLGLPGGVQPGLLPGVRPRRVPALQPGRRRPAGPADGLHRHHGLRGRVQEAPGVRARAGRRLPVPHSRRDAGELRPAVDGLRHPHPARRIVRRPATSSRSTPRSSSSTRTSSRSSTRPTISKATA